jgi:hypothetical protein
MSYVSGEPFVCRIQGRPDSSSEDCNGTPPANAYWGLFSSDGKPATWSYSSRGVSSLKVPAGGSIGWRFQNGGSLDRPGAAPTAAKTSGGGTGGTTGGSSGGSSGGGTGGSSGSGSGGHTGGATTSPAGGGAQPIKSPSATPSTSPKPTPTPHKDPTTKASPTKHPNEKQKSGHTTGAAKKKTAKSSDDQTHEAAGTPVAQPSVLTSPTAASTDDDSGSGARFVAVGVLVLLGLSVGAVALRRRGSREAP